MPVIRLESLDDPWLLPYRHLKDTNATRWQGMFIAEGDKLTRRLLESDYPLISVVVVEDQLDRYRALVPAETPLLVLPRPLVSQLVGFNFHHGVVSCGRRKPLPHLAELVAPVDRALLLLVCVEINDPENLGGIFRAASAFGADAVLLGEHCADPFSRRVLRVSMGTVWKLPMLQSRELIGDLAQMRHQWEVELVASVLDDTAEPLQRFRRPPRLALLLGNEGHGLPQSYIAACNRRVTIPMSRGTDSLNVAVAAAVFLHQFVCSLEY